MIIGDVASVTSLAMDVAELSRAERAKKLFRTIFTRRIRIAVYGDSGVGKSQFLRMVTGNNSYLSVSERTRSLEYHNVTLRSGRKIQLIDMPGHESNKAVRDKILNDITRGKIDGVINVVDYGYQDSELLQKDPSTAFKTGTNDVKPEYLRDNRKREIMRTQEFIDRIGPDVKLKWVITVINKADVWHRQRQDIIDYYTSGEYYNTIRTIEKACSLEVRPLCSVITPFGNKEMVLTYCERDKVSDFESLLSLIEEIIK